MDTAPRYGGYGYQGMRSALDPLIADLGRPPVPAQVIRLTLRRARTSSSRPSVVRNLDDLDSHAQQTTIDATMIGGMMIAATTIAVTMDVTGELAKQILGSKIQAEHRLQLR